MKNKKLSRSLRKHIRREKARIRREVLDMKEQEKLIRELYEKFLKSRTPTFLKKAGVKVG